MRFFLIHRPAGLIFYPAELQDDVKTNIEWRTWLCPGWLLMGIHWDFIS
jgi:hypothetical protein